VARPTPDLRLLGGAVHNRHISVGAAAAGTSITERARGGNASERDSGRPSRLAMKPQVRTSDDACIETT
jgi:hypothetical protein